MNCHTLLLLLQLLHYIIIIAIISSLLSRAEDDKDACNLLPGGLTFYCSPCHETKHKICSREINLTTGEIKWRWDTGRQPAVSHSVGLFFSPAASFRSSARRKDETGLVWHSHTGLRSPQHPCRTNTSTACTRAVTMEGTEERHLPWTRSEPCAPLLTLHIHVSAVFEL